MIKDEEGEKPEMGENDSEQEEIERVPEPGTDQQDIGGDIKRERQEEYKPPSILPNEIQDLIDWLNEEDAKQKEHEGKVDKYIEEKRKQGK